MRRLYRHELTTTSGGNVSLRIEDDLVAITPAALDKGRLTTEQVALMRFDGTNLTPHLKPSIETRLHLRVYELNPHVRAIIHAHPVTATAFTATDVPIQCELLVEPYALVGPPVMAPYALVGSDALAETIADCATRAPCILMENHGVVTVGATLLQAFDRMELIEAAARTTLIARQLGSVRPLTQSQLAKLDKMMGRTDS